VLLTLARMWRTAATGAFVPKDAAAAWAAARLPSAQGAWLELAGRAYVGARADDWHGREAVVAALTERLRWEIERACSLTASTGSGNSMQEGSDAAAESERQSEERAGRP